MNIDQHTTGKSSEDENVQCIDIKIDQHTHFEFSSKKNIFKNLIVAKDVSYYTQYSF